MGTWEFRAITVDDIPAIASLLIDRQNTEIRVYPSLKNICLNTRYITDTIVELFHNSKVIGMGAFSHEELVGYIIGEIEIDTMRGRHVWVPYEGLAIRADQSPELIRYLYAKVAILWLQQGCFSHYALVPLGNQVYLDALMRLSFSIQQVHSIMGMTDYVPFENVSDCHVRLASINDREAMGRMSTIIFSHQNSSPVFEPALPERIAAIKEGYKGTVEDSDSTVLIATKDMKEVGFQIYETITSDLMTPDNGIELSVAGTYPLQMGNGIGKKLMNEGYRMMKEKGYSSIITDWRITNLASSTFWPKCGFKPLAYRMVRYIDKDVAWANFNNPSISL